MHSRPHAAGERPAPTPSITDAFMVISRDLNARRAANTPGADPVTALPQGVEEKVPQVAPTASDDSATTGDPTNAVRQPEKEPVEPAPPAPSRGSDDGRHGASPVASEHLARSLRPTRVVGEELKRVAEAAWGDGEDQAPESPSPDTQATLTDTPMLVVPKMGPQKDPSRANLNPSPEGLPDLRQFRGSAVGWFGAPVHHPRTSGDALVVAPRRHQT